MPIAGVIILTVPDKANQVVEQLQGFENVTTYGIHKTNNVVAVLEGESPDELEKLTDQIKEQVEGVIGIYPAYVNFEDASLEETESR